MKKKLYLFMATISACISLSASARAETSQTSDLDLFHFNEKSEQRLWGIVNDDVMGGISTSKVSVKEGIAHFTGNVSLENNGGFASTRARIQNAKLKGYYAIKLRVKGDGKKYKLSLRTGSQWNSANYQITFPTKKDEWLEHTLLMEKMKPTWRGRSLSLPSIKPEEVGLIGLSISDKQSGPFQLEVDWIKAVKTHDQSPATNKGMEFIPTSANSPDPLPF